MFVSADWRQRADEGSTTTVHRTKAFVRAELMGVGQKLIGQTLSGQKFTAQMYFEVFSVYL